jgi:hypothetical protein
VLSSTNFLTTSGFSFSIYLQQSQFSGYALEIDDVATHESRAIYLVLAGLANTITSYALGTNATWPYVTIPHYEIRGENFREITSTNLISFAPIVQQIQKWNEYSFQNQGWLKESFDYRGYREVPMPIREMYRKVDGEDDEEQEWRPELQVEGNDSKFYCPLWQESEAPHDTGSINYNLIDHPTFGPLFRTMRKSKAPVLSDVFDPTSMLGESAKIDYGDGKYHPQSIILQPIYKDFNEESDLVATLLAVVPWDGYFTNMLHQGANGIILVMRDTCGDEFSYRIDGDKATFLGQGDYHESQYDYLEHVVDFGAPVEKYSYGKLG